MIDPNPIRWIFIPPSPSSPSLSFLFELILSWIGHPGKEAEAAQLELRLIIRMPHNAALTSPGRRKAAFLTDTTGIILTWQARETFTVCSCCRKSETVGFSSCTVWSTLDKATCLSGQTRPSSLILQLSRTIKWLPLLLLLLNAFGLSFKALAITVA